TRAPTGWSPESGAKRSLALGAGLGLGVVALLGVGFMAYGHHADPPPVEHVVEVKPTVPVAPPVPEMVKLQVTTGPVGAQIFDGTQLIGTAPASLVLPRSRGAINLSFKLAGYVPLTQGVDLTQPPGDLAIKLSPEPVVVKPTEPVVDKTTVPGKV